MDIPKRYKIDPETGETYSVQYNWVNMEEDKNREQILRDILKRFNGMHVLDEVNISDLVNQLNYVATPKIPDSSDNKEPDALITIKERAEQKLKKLEKCKSRNGRLDILRTVLRDIKSELHMHIVSYFSKK